MILLLSHQAFFSVCRFWWCMAQRLQWVPALVLKCFGGLITKLCGAGGHQMILQSLEWSVKSHTITVPTSLYWSHKSWWSHCFMLFMPVSQPTTIMLEQKSGVVGQCGLSVIWWWYVCCCNVTFFLAVRLGLLLLSICLNMWAVVCSEMLCSTSLFLQQTTGIVYSKNYRTNVSYKQSTTIYKKAPLNSVLTTFLREKYCYINHLFAIFSLML